MRTLNTKSPSPIGRGGITHFLSFIKKMGEGFGVSLGFWILILGFAAEAAKGPVSMWGERGVIVNDTAGNTIQQHPKITKIGSSEYMMVWEDFRSGNSDLYIQRIRENGDRLFEKNGVPLAAAPNEQIFPQITADDLGGAFVVWQDNRNGNFDIYLQKVDSAGNQIFQNGGVAVCSSPDSQVFPEMVSDGQNGVIIAWHDYRSKDEDIYAQRIDGAGNAFWGADGVPVCREKGTQWFPRLAPDGLGGAFIVWADRRSADFDIYSQHLDYAGKPAWGANGAPVSIALGNQENPRIVSNGQGGAFAAWADARPNAEGVYIQNLDSSGKKVFPDSAIRLSSSFSGPAAPDIAYDGMLGAIIVWSDAYAGDPDIYMQKVKGSGELLWGEEAMPVARVRGAQENPRIFGHSPFFIAWEDMRGAGKQIYLQEIDGDGDMRFGYEGIAVARDQRNAQSADLALGDGGAAVVCYQDDKRGNFDIFGQRITSKGELSWSQYGKLINNAFGSVAHQNFSVSSDNRNNLYFAFEDKRSGRPNVYAQKMNPDGLLMWDFDAAAAAREPYDQLKPVIAADGRGGAYAAWEDYRDSQPKIFIQYFNPQGEPLWEGGLSITPGAPGASQKKPMIIPDGSGGAIVIFADRRNSLDSQDIYVQRISGKGNLLFSQFGKVVSAGGGAQDDPSIDPQSLVAAWTDYRNGERNSDIYAQKIDLSGNTFWEEDGIPVCEAPDSQIDASITSDTQGGVIISWTDRGGGNFDIYAQRLNMNGQELWLKDGVPVCQIGRTQQRPKIISTGAGASFLVWEDFRHGNWDIFAQILSDQGRVGISEEGIAICPAAGTQYNPDLIKQGQRAIIAWEDYRSNSTYNIYMQAFDLSGGSIWESEGYFVPMTRSGAREPRLVTSGANEFVLAWEDHRNGGRAIYAQKFKY